MPSNNMECCKLMKLLGNNGCLNCNHRDPSKLQFAAIDSHIDFMELPLLSTHEPFGTEVKCSACIRPDFSTSATIISIIATYQMFHSVVIFSQSLRDIEEALDCVPSEFRSIVVVTPSSVAKNSFCIYSKGSDKFMTASESGMIKFVKGVVGDMSLTMYLYPESVSYAYMFQGNTNSLWVTRCNNALRVIGNNGTRIMPMFYTEPNVTGVLYVNAGTPVTTVGGSGPGLQQRLYSITNSTLNAVSKGGMCYFCAYMQKCHDVLCGNASKHQNIVVKLSDNFRPDVNSV